jgi:hypothetical protein
LLRLAAVLALSRDRRTAGWLPQMLWSFRLHPDSIFSSVNQCKAWLFVKAQAANRSTAFRQPNHSRLLSVMLPHPMLVQPLLMSLNCLSATSACLLDCVAASSYHSLAMFCASMCQLLGMEGRFVFRL